MQKPISIARRDYIVALCDLTNNCGLPAFVVADILAATLENMRREADAELKRDEAIWRKALSGVNDNGGEVDKRVPD